MKQRERHRLKTIGKTVTPYTRIPDSKLIELRAAHDFLSNCYAIYTNSRCEVHCFPCATEIGAVMQVNIRRHGDLEELTWRELQDIKNEVFGSHTQAVEVFPEASEEWNPLAKVRVLWIMPTGWRLPFGLSMQTAWGKGFHEKGL